MKYLSLILFIFIPILLFSQGGLIINAGQFRIQSGHVVIAANGKWTNNATVNCVTGSTVDFVGNTLQTIQGTNTTAFSNLTTNNSGGGIIIGRNISTLGILLITNGSIDLKNSVIDLSTSGQIIGETETNRIKGTDGLGVDGFGTGTITATRINPNGNVAGLGLEFTPTVVLGNTLITRGHKRLPGSGTFSGNWSVLRYYDIQPTNLTTLTINKFNYWGGIGNPELNGHIEANLQMFQRVNYGGPTYWEPRASVPNAGADFVSSTTVDNSVGGIIRITLGSTTTPLPIELINFKAKCNNNTNILSWQTSSEYNNDYFSVEKSTDGENFTGFTHVFSQGNSSVIQNYISEDFTPFNGTSYYRLQQFDFDGNNSYSEIISTNCKSKSFKEDIFIISPSDYSVDAIIQGIPGNLYQIKLTNVLGQVITNKTITLTDYQQSVKIYNSNLAIGMYFLVMQTKTKNISKPLIVNH
jgi:hypothetical protein